MSNRDANSGEVSPADPSIVTVPTTTSADQQSPRAGGDWWEVLLVLCFTCIPGLFWSYMYLERKAWLDPDYPQDLVWDYASRLMYAPIDCTLVLYLVWRNGERWARFGVVPIRWIRDPIAAIGCFIAVVAAYWMGEVMLFAEPKGDGPLFLQTHAIAAYAKLTSTPNGLLLWFFSTCASAFAEELVFRGYLVTRLSRLLQSSWMAVLVAAVIFASLHFYQGFEGVLPAWVMGVVYGGLFLRLRTLWPLALAHSAYNLWVTWV